MMYYLNSFQNMGRSEFFNMSHIVRSYCTGMCTYLDLHTVWFDSDACVYVYVCVCTFICLSDVCVCVMCV